MDPNDSSSILPAHEFISVQIEREREKRGRKQFCKKWRKNLMDLAGRRRGVLRRTYRHDGRRWYELTRTRFASIPGAMIGANSMVHHRHLYSFIRNVELLHASSSTRLNWGSPNCAQLHCHSSGSHVVSSICSSRRIIHGQPHARWNNRGEFLLEQIKLPVARIF